MKLKVGADPEFFLLEGTKPVSAHDLVPGTKDKPHPLKTGAIQADGTAVEFNIDPAETSEEFCSNLKSTLGEIRKMIPDKLQFGFVPSVVYPKAYFDALPDYPKELGCNPDFNAYTGRVNPPPGSGTRPNPTMRTGAGHIHIGWTNKAKVDDPSHMWDCCELVKQLDQYFERYAKVWDKDERRASLYGARGAFRPKPYGCEYRVLSNAWLKYPKLWPWIFDSVKYIVERMEDGNFNRYYDRYRRRPGVTPYTVLDDAESIQAAYFPGAPKFPLDYQKAA